MSEETFRVEGTLGSRETDPVSVQRRAEIQLGMLAQPQGEE